MADKYESLNIRKLHLDNLDFVWLSGMEMNSYFICVNSFLGANLEYLYYVGQISVDSTVQLIVRNLLYGLFRCKLKCRQYNIQ